MALTDIIKGHLNEMLNTNEELSRSRIDICQRCPLIKKTNYGLICNRDLWINPLTGESSTYPQTGYYRGCGCRLNAKTQLTGAHCPAKKW